MKITITCFILLISTSALAQNQNSKPPEFQAMVDRYMEEINSNLQCRAALITDRQEIQRLKAEIEELKKDKKK